MTAHSDPGDAEVIPIHAPGPSRHERGGPARVPTTTGHCGICGHPATGPACPRCAEVLTT